MSRKDENRDYLKRANFPKQTYALSGTDWSDASIDRTNGKLVVDGAPMIITPLPPGCLATDDETWQQTYGASMDAFLSLLNGTKLSIAIQSANSNVPSTSVFKDAIFHAANSNIYEQLDGRQQIQYVVSKDTVIDATAAADFGAVTEARSVALRGPIHLVGWGKTIGMRPTDPDPVNSRDNDDDHKLDRTTWKPGMLDARWDEMRQCWRAWNDLVADPNGNNLGTLVFGTNTDLTEGFPFIRGKLEDVWTVRRTHLQEGTPISAAKLSDLPKTAEVMTILSHRLYQSSKSAAGPLSDVFIVNQSKGPGSTLTVGTETTIDALLTISTSAEFNTDAGQSGPISFVPALPNDDTLVLGDMYWNGAEWQPGVSIDLCAIAGDKLDILYNNDVQLGTALFETVDALNDLIIETIDSFVEAEEEVNREIVVILNSVYTPSIEDAIKAAVDNVYNVMANNVQAAINQATANMADSVEAAFADIATSLLENCGCSVTVPELFIQPVFIPSAELPLTDIAVVFNDVAFTVPNGHGPEPIVNLINPCDPLAAVSFP